MNRLKPLIIKTLGHSNVANSEKSKIAADKNHFMIKSQCVYIENQIKFANIVYIYKIYI